MVRQRTNVGDGILRAEISKLAGGELGTIVCDDGVWEAMLAKDLVVGCWSFELPMEGWLEWPLATWRRNRLILGKSLRSLVLRNQCGDETKVSPFSARVLAITLADFWQLFGSVNSIWHMFRCRDPCWASMRNSGREISSGSYLDGQSGTDGSLCCVETLVLRLCHQTAGSLWQHKGSHDDLPDVGDHPRVGWMAICCGRRWLLPEWYYRHWLRSGHHQQSLVMRESRSLTARWIYHLPLIMLRWWCLLQQGHGCRSVWIMHRPGQNSLSVGIEYQNHIPATRLPNVGDGWRNERECLSSTRRWRVEVCGLWAAWIYSHRWVCGSAGRRKLGQRLLSLFGYIVFQRTSGSLRRASQPSQNHQGRHVRRRHQLHVGRHRQRWLLANGDCSALRAYWNWA